MYDDFKLGVCRELEGSTSKDDDGGYFGVCKGLTKDFFTDET